MGIRQLQSFMERHLQGGVHPVQMEDEIRKARKREGDRPLIVMDFQTFFDFFCQDRLGTLCGSQGLLVERLADELFGRLVAAGAELVFYCDGTLQPTKFDTWLRRQDSKYERMIAIFDAVDANKPLEVIAGHFQHIPNNAGLKMRRVAERHGKVVISMDVECDQALAAYATKRNAFAVISSDTDFLIYQGNWQLWSPTHIDKKTLQTLSYNRDALLRALGLRRDQMAVWATLAGNDFFKYDELEPFHRRLGPYRQKFYKLAEYVRSLPHKKQLTQHAIQKILKHVYSPRTPHPGAHEQFEHSIKFYRIEDEHLNLDKQHQQPVEKLELFLLNQNQLFVLSILKRMSINCSQWFLDCRPPHDGRFFEILTSIISRMAGIILFFDEKNDPKQAIVATKRSHSEPFTKYTIVAELPTTLVPPKIEELLTQDAKPSASLLTRKLHLLAWVCSDQLPAQSFAALPTSLMLTVMTCFRLVECGALALFEADLLLWIGHELSVGGFDPVAERKPYRLDPRAFRIGFLFQKVYGEFSRAAKALGLSREYRPSVTYDGYRFHNQYDAWHEGRSNKNIELIAKWRLYTKGALDLGSEDSLSDLSNLFVCYKIV